MRTCFLAFTCAFLLLGSFVLSAHAGPSRQQEVADEGASGYTDDDMERLVQNAALKRSCVRRGGNCDHRPKDCCYNSSCRCNLWGANCRCQRMGLFQKWG